VDLLDAGRCGTGAPSRVEATERETRNATLGARSIACMLLAMSATLGAGGGLDAVGFHNADAEYSPSHPSASRLVRSVRQEPPGRRGRRVGLCAI